MVIPSLLLLGISPALSASELAAGFQVESEEPTVGLPKATAGVRRIEKEPRSIPGPDGEPLPFRGLDEVLEFLRTAKVIEKKTYWLSTSRAGLPNMVQVAFFSAFSAKNICVEAEVKSRWVPRFREVLSEKKVLLFLQLENKMDAVINYDLAESIPLVH